MNKADILLAKEGRLTFQEARKRRVLRFYLLGLGRLIAAVIGFNLCIAVGIWLLHGLVR
jgi:hypothetical protein